MFEVKLSHADILKKIIEAIKDLVNDAPITCTDTQMTLMAMDPSHIATVSLKMETGLFALYRCDRPISIAVSIVDLAKIMKCTKPEDSCLIRFEDNGDETMLFRLEDTLGGNRKEDITLKLLNMHYEQPESSQESYAAKIEMPSAEFQKACRDIAIFSDTLTFKTYTDKIVFCGRGDTVDITLTYDNQLASDIRSEIAIDVKSPMRVNFSIKYLNHFAKASHISDRVKISLRSSGHVEVQYDVDGHGHLRYFLAPKVEEPDSSAMTATMQ